MNMTWLVFPAFIATLVVLRRPLWGIFLVLLLSPLKNLGGEFILFARLAGVFTIAVTFLGYIARRKKIRWAGIEAPVFIMGLGISLSFFRTINVGEVFDTLLSLVSLYGFVLIIYNLIENEQQLQGLLMVYLFSGVIPIIQAFAQRAAGPSYVGQEFVRVSGTFTLPTGLGAFLIPYLLVATALLYYPGFSRFHRMLLVGFIGGGYAALFFTVSRGAFFAFFLGLGILVLLLRAIPKNENKRSPLMVFLMIGLVVFITVQEWGSAQNRLVAPISEFFVTDGSDKNILARANEISILVNITLDNKFLGTGIGNYAQSILRYRYLYNAPSLPLVPHNIFLYLFGEVGFVMVIGFLGLYGSIVKRIYTFYAQMKNRTHSLTFYVYCSSSAALLGYTIFMITHSGLFVNEIWLSIALLIVSARLVSTVEEENLQVTKRLRWKTFVRKI